MLAVAVAQGGRAAVPEFMDGQGADSLLLVRADVSSLVEAPMTAADALRRLLADVEEVREWRSADVRTNGGPPPLGLCPPSTLRYLERLALDGLAVNDDDSGDHRGPFPVRECLEILADATEHLRGDHDCDCPGHERRKYAAIAARQHLLDGLAGEAERLLTCKWCGSDGITHETSAAHTCQGVLTYGASFEPTEDGQP